MFEQHRERIPSPVSVLAELIECTEVAFRVSISLTGCSMSNLIRLGSYILSECLN